MSSAIAIKHAESRELPILFSAPMVRALISGSKTQTRRVVRLPFAGELPVQVHPKKTGPLELTCSCYHLSDTVPVTRIVKSPWRVGDKLWVRETWRANPAASQFRDVHFRADLDEQEAPGQWRPSIFMPRWASRIDLEITAVRVQRLQEIDEEDARAEGCRGERDPSGEGLDVEARDEFRDLWDSINGARGFAWNTNPWVWAITFRRVRT